MKQRLGIAAATMMSRELIVLDEPTNALDADGVEMVKRIIEEEKERNAAIVIASHDQVLIEEFADDVYMIFDGEITGHSETTIFDLPKEGRGMKTCEVVEKIKQ